MKKIFSIFVNDLKSTTKNLIVFVVIIGITILPALYAWFNIAANMDPYSNTGGIGFAVCSNDKGYTYKKLTINAGDKVVSGLEGNTQMGWDFVDESDAIKGVETGKYYAAVIIPEDFSKNLLSITTGDFTQAKLQYYVNEKKNAVAPKITDAGISAIEENVASAYVSSLTETIASILEVAETDFESEKENLSEKIISDLKNSKTDIQTFSASLDVLLATLDSIDSLIETNQEMLPSIKESLASAGVFSNDVKSTISSTKGVASQVSSSIDGTISSGATYMDNVSEQLDTIFGTLSDDADAVADKLQKVEEINQKILTINNTLLGIVKNIQSSLGIDCSKIIDALNRANDKQNAIIDKINSICDNIRTTGSIPADAQSTLEGLVHDADTELDAAKSEFSAIKQDLDDSMTESFSTLDDITGFLQSLNAGTNELDKTFNSALETNANLKEVLQNLKTFLSTVDKKIDTLIEKVQDVESSNLIENIVTPIIENPESLGSFVSSPVAYDTHELYATENYGSSMSPFYSALALWVGCIVLVAVLNVDLTKKDLKKLGKANSVQLFFGRYLMFFVLSQIQALIIALGDLYFLQVQCNHPLLFIVTCLISSFVYSMIIYSLTITFSVIGKAIAVIILILQVAGSGGTFPIEMLPDAFQAIAPFLPFKYGINAMRETVSGITPGAYTKYIGVLLLFIVPALVLGLLLRKPCIRIVAFFNKKVEESDLVI